MPRHYLALAIDAIGALALLAVAYAFLYVFFILAP
jgi:hypothetical protein